jgi:tripartite-type tricarboxylate transporter receptor subunit TctC
MTQNIKVVSQPEAQAMRRCDLVPWLTRFVVTVMALISITITQQSQAQTGAKFPERSIRFVVPFPPGGGNDILARALAPLLSDGLGQSVVVENKGGAGGNIGAEFVARSAPDGYTMLIAANQITINPWLDNKLPFDIEKDFVTVAQIASVPMVLVVHPSVPAQNLNELPWLKQIQENSIMERLVPVLPSTSHLSYLTTRPAYKLCMFLIKAPDLRLLI